MRVSWPVTQQQAVYQESVSAGTCLLSRCLALDMRVTISCAHRLPKGEGGKSWMTPRSRQHKHLFGRATLLFHHFLKLWEEKRSNNELTRRCVEPWYQRNKETTLTGTTLSEDMLHYHEVSGSY
jgi:hypothetical protein